MICIVIKGPTLKEVHKQMQAALPLADLLEWRLDGFENLDLEQLSLLRQQCQIPIIFTLRSARQGGQYKGSEEQRLDWIKKLMALKPNYMDLEHDVPQVFIAFVRVHTQVILSYHNFEVTPSDLAEVYTCLTAIPADIYKVAVLAQSITDALRLIDFIKYKPKNVIGISMGKLGEISRIIGPLSLRLWTYATLDEHLQTAPGQLTADVLQQTYYYSALHAGMPLYGLIGNPIDKSISHWSHNATLHSLHLQSIYLKMQVEAHELSCFIPLAKKLGFKGLSVTMPLKEAIYPYIDVLESSAQNIGAVNTIAFEGEQVIGYNTDGTGALNAIEEKIKAKGCRFIILGAGGAAKAIAYEAKQRGAEVVILNRCAKRAVQLAKHLNCIGGDLAQMKMEAYTGYHVLINCTPEGLPIDPDHILSNAVVMDLTTQPKDTPLLMKAKQKGCSIVYGYEMFVYQAIEQFEIWFKDLINKEQCLIILRSIVQEHIL